MNIKYWLDVVRCSFFEPDWCSDSTSIQYFWTGNQTLETDSQKKLKKILKIIILLYIIPKQFTVKAHPALFEGEGQKNGRTLSRGFGLRSFCQLVISTWVEILCPVQFNKAGPWGGGGSRREGRGEKNLNEICKKIFSNLIYLVHCWRQLKTTCCIRLCRCALCC